MPRSSGQNAMPARAIASEVRLISSRPSKLTEPVRLPQMPMMDFRVVVLPAPFRPKSVTTSPGKTSKSTPCRMCDSPYQAWRPLTFSSAPLPGCSGIASPHIGFAHPRIVGDGGVVAFRQHAPPCENGYTVREIGDDAEIVLDHQHRSVR